MRYISRETCVRTALFESGVRETLVSFETRAQSAGASRPVPIATRAPVRARRASAGSAARSSCESRGGERERVSRFKEYRSLFCRGPQSAKTALKKNFEKKPSNSALRRDSGSRWTAQQRTPCSQTGCGFFKNPKEVKKIHGARVASASASPTHARARLVYFSNSAPTFFEEKRDAVSREEDRAARVGRPCCRTAAAARARRTASAASRPARPPLAAQAASRGARSPRRL